MILDAGLLIHASTPNLLRLARSLGLDVSEYTSKLRLIRAIAAAVAETTTERKWTGYYS